MSATPTVVHAEMSQRMRVEVGLAAQFHFAPVAGDPAARRVGPVGLGRKAVIKGALTRQRAAIRHRSASARVRRPVGEPAGIGSRVGVIDIGLREVRAMPVVGAARQAPSVDAEVIVGLVTWYFMTSSGGCRSSRQGHRPPVCPAGTRLPGDSVAVMASSRTVSGMRPPGSVLAPEQRTGRDQAAHRPGRRRMLARDGILSPPRSAAAPAEAAVFASTGWLTAARCALHAARRIRRVPPPAPSGRCSSHRSTMTCAVAPRFTASIRLWFT